MIVEVHFIHEHEESWMRLVELIKKELVDPSTGAVLPERDFLYYYNSGEGFGAK
jgi:hypothetical protein